MSLLATVKAVFWIAVGVTAHDIASVSGWHVDGLHAYYFSAPIAGFLALMLFVRWMNRNWGTPSGF